MERAALALQACSLIQGAGDAVASAFCAARLGDHGFHFGTLGANAPIGELIERALPEL